MRKFSMMSMAAAAVLAAGAAIALDNSEELDIDLTAAMAERRIDIKGGVFFPPMVLAKPGDKFVVRNQEEVTHNATAIDGSWTTGPIEPGEEVLILVTGNMTMCFESTENDEYKGAFGSIETGVAPECFELSGAGDEEENAQN